MFKSGEQLSAMLCLAVNSHYGQYDKSGQPYILHPLAVMNMLNSNDEELLCIALGHDLVEDCKVTYQQLRGLEFTERIIEGIRCLTKVPGETREEYMAKVMSNPDAVKVKMCDLRHNSDITRLKGLTQKDIDRTIYYHQFYTELKQVAG